MSSILPLVLGLFGEKQPLSRNLDPTLPPLRKRVKYRTGSYCGAGRRKGDPPCVASAHTHPACQPCLQGMI